VSTEEDKGELENKFRLSEGGETASGILDFGLAGVGVFPEVEEALVIGGRFFSLPRFLINLTQHKEAFGVDISKMDSS